MSQKIKFRAVQETNFTATLQSRINSYFIDNNISEKGNLLMAVKIVFTLAGFIGSYLLVFVSGENIFFSILSWILLGLFTAFVGFNISHDAVHGSISSNKLVNKILGYTFNLAGTNKYMWKIMHNVIHHTYTNIPGHDEDLEPVALIRLSTENKLKKVHKYQHFYAYLLYCLTSISWVFKKDFVSFFRKKMGNYENKKHPVKEYFVLFFFKALYFFIFIALPLLFAGVPWWVTVIGFVSMHLIQGLTLAVVFQLAHVVEGAHFPQPDEKGDVMNNWTIHQLNTTANFAMKSFLATWFFGGLNYQIEHHLFPNICHIHYPQISQIVAATAHEYGVKYNTNETMWDAIKSHTRMLKVLGRKESLLPQGVAAA